MKVRDRKVVQSQFPAGYIAQRHCFILGLSLSRLTNNVLEPILIAACGLFLFNVFTSIQSIADPVFFASPHPSNSRLAT